MTNKIYDLADQLFKDLPDDLRMTYRDLIIEVIMKSSNPSDFASAILNYDHDKVTPHSKNYSLIGMRDETSEMLKPFIQRVYHDAPRNTPGDVDTVEWTSCKENRNKGRVSDRQEWYRAMHQGYQDSEFTDIVEYLHKTTR